MKKQHIVITLLLALLLVLLCGCHGENTDPPTTDQTGTQTIGSDTGDGTGRVVLSAEERARNLQSMSFDWIELKQKAAVGTGAGTVHYPYHMHDRICVPMDSNIDSEYTLYTALLDYDGELVDTVIHKGLADLYEGERIGTFWLLDTDGTVLGLTDHNQETQTRFLFIADSTGNVLHEAVLPSSGNWQTRLVATEQYLVLNIFQDILIFDRSLTQLRQVTFTDYGVVTFIDEADNGTLTVSFNNLAEFRSVYYELNLDTGVYTVNDTLASVDSSIMGAAIQYTDDYDRYYIGGAGVYGWIDGATENDTLLTWTGVGMTSEGAYPYDVINMNAMLVQYRDIITGKKAYYLLRRSEKPMDDRRELVLGLVGLGSQMEAYLANAASQFNSTQDQWNVTVRTYETVDTGFETTRAVDTYGNDVITGNAPDIVGVGNAFDPVILSVAQKGGYTDLSDVFGDVMLPCIRDAYQTEYGMYAVPMRFIVDTFVTAADTEGADLDSVYAAAAALDEGEALYSMPYSYQLNRVLTVGLESFMDRESGSCNFDSDAFIEFLRFYDALEQYNNTELGYVYEGGMAGSTIAYAGSPDIVTNFVCGHLRCLYLPVTKVNILYGLTETFRDVPFSFCGYPSNDGMRSYLTGMGNMMITADTEHYDGALAFLQYLFTEEIQSSEGLSDYGMSPIMEHLETALAKSVYVYDTRGYLSEIDSSGTPVYYRSCIGSFHPDDPMLAEFAARPDKYVIERFTEEETAHIRSLFYETEMQSMADQTVMSIINEELSYWQNGVKSLEETAKIIQSRVWIYLNE
ncbi:MAG: extracellular solute-binding protein [Clostridia bacterium]|nr:extracellular solute-binding protein [Clostridia bacterium]